MAKLTEAAELGSPRTSRAASVSSERTSTAGFAIQPLPLSAKPGPAYVAASAASQIVTDIYDSDANLDRDGDLLAPMSQGALFSEDALVLVNAFLDYLLYCILASARGTALDTIRNAIFDVLKQKLAREATADADYELANLMGDDEDESADESDPTAASWDLERVWKRTRLRIMVYTRLGEMDDDEELEYLDYEEEAADMGLIPPAAAIFLTSVMESVAEKTIRSAGQAALSRIIREAKKDGYTQHRVIVEERDAEKIALDSTLGRLWRTWKRNSKGPPARHIETPVGSRPASTPRLGNGHYAKRESIDTVASVVSSQEYRRTSIPDVLEIPDDQVSETDIAANIPLPMSENDVAEIDGEFLTLEIAAILLAAASNGGRPVSISWPIFKSPTLDLPIVRRTRSFSELERSDSFGQDATEVEDDDDGTPAKLTEKIRQWKNSLLANASSEDTSTDASVDGGSDEDEIRDDKSASSVLDGADDAQVFNVTRMSIGVPPASPAVVRTLLGEVSPSAHDSGPSRAEEELSEVTSEGYVTPYEATKTVELGVAGAAVGAVLAHEHTKKKEVEKEEEEAGVRTATYEDDSDEADERVDEEQASRAIGVARTSDVPISASDEKAISQAVQSKSEPTPTTAKAEASSATARGYNVERASAQKDAALARPRSPGSKVLTTLQEDATADTKSNSETADSPSDRQAKTKFTTYVIGQPVTLRADGQNAIQAASASSTEKSEKPRLPPKDGAAGTSRDRSSSKPSVHSIGEQRPPSSGYVMLRRSGSTAHSSSGFDNSPVQYSRGFDPKESIEDRERKFDDLIRNEETVKYTLTPQNMRDLDISPPVQPTTPTKSRKLSFGGSVHSDRSQSKVAPIVTNTTKPVNPQISSPTSVNSDGPNMKTTVPRSQVINTKATKKGFVPREPQARHESVFDMADYLRTTSPPKDNNPIIPRVIQSNYTQRTAAASQSQAVSVPSAQPKLRLQPRSAVLAPSTTSDLISLIREGPPGNSRRSDGVDSVNSIPASTGPSTSRTNLLPSREATQTAISAKPQRPQQANSSGPDRPAVTRTQRRVKDPYAISDDEEDDEDDVLTALPKKNRRTEESLVDFLKKVEPPANNGPTLLAPSSTATARIGQGSPNGATSPSSPPQGAMLKSKITIIPNASTFKPRSKPIARPAGSATDKTIRLESYRGNLDIADFLRSTGPDDAAAAAPAPLVGAKKDLKEKKGMKLWRRRE